MQDYGREDWGFAEVKQQVKQQMKLQVEPGEICPISVFLL